MRRKVPPIPTLAEMIESCEHNRDVARFQLGRINQQLEREAPGPARELLKKDQSRYRSDFDHWADYVAYYRAREAREGPDTVPKIRRGQLPAVMEVALEPDRRLPREPGDDDEETGELPF